MLYHIVTTPECNLCCAYCGEKAFCEPETKDGPVFESVPGKIQYPLTDLKAFLHKDTDPNGVYLTFYGGEPLLNMSGVTSVMDALKSESKVRGFMIQTNGTLLNRLEQSYVNRFHTILVSLDGGKEITNKNRGEGTYEKIIANLKKITSQGYHGELIARMTIEEPADFFTDITYLIENPEFSFTSIHWQLDANFWHDYEKRHFSEWSKKYNADVTKLADYWITHVESGNVIRLYPFLGLLDSIMNGTQYHLRCGSGIGNFSILPNGKIAVCPIMSGVSEHYVGDINHAEPQKLVNKVNIGEPCLSCTDLELCGGRCLFSNLYPAWPKEGVNEVCDTTRHLIKEMQRIAPRLEQALKKGIIKKEQLAFIPYNGTEIIP